MTFLFTRFSSALLACPYCEAATGAASRTAFDYAVTVLAALAVGAAVTWAFKCLFQPGEQGSAHVKSTVLDDEEIEVR
jgi:hypothetical protein